MYRMFRKGKKRKTPSGNSGRAMSKYETVISNRTGKKRVKVKTKKRRRKSKSELTKLKTRLKKVEGKTTTPSKYEFYVRNYYKLRQQGDTAGINSQTKRIFYMKGWDHVDIEAEYQNGFRPSSDPSNPTYQPDDRNTNLPWKTWTRYTIKNAFNSQVNVRYVGVKCIDHTNLNPVQVIETHMQKRGIGVGVANYPAVANNASQVEYPIRLRIPDNKNFMKVLSYAYSSPLKFWKKMGDIKEITLLPGEQFTCYLKASYNYKPEVRDIEASATYLKNDHGLLVSVVGEIAHGDGAPSRVGRDDFNLDVEAVKYGCVRFDDSKSEHLIKTIDTETYSAPTEYEQFGANHVEQ